MMDEAKVLEKVREMRGLIRIGRERITRHSPVWAVFLAGETFRSLAKALDDLEGAAGGDPAAERLRRAG